MKLALNSIYVVITLIVLLSCSSAVDNKDRNDPKAIELNDRAMGIFTKYQFFHVSKVVSEMEEALNLLDSAIATDEKYYTAYMNKVNVLSKLDRLSDAIEVLSFVINDSENNAEIYSTRGFFYEKLDDMENANKDYLLSLKSYDNRLLENPNSIEDKTGKIFISIFIDGKEQAIEKIELLEKQNPNDLNVKIIKDGIEEFDRKQYIEGM